ncbi:MAG: hypothetical protein R3F18_02320 [Lysobacterales bacterium]
MTPEIASESMQVKSTPTSIRSWTPCRNCPDAQRLGAGPVLSGSLSVGRNRRRFRDVPPGTVKTRLHACPGTRSGRDWKELEMSVDELMMAAPSKEDQELLARHGEPGYFAQAFGLVPRTAEPISG